MSRRIFRPLFSATKPLKSPSGINAGEGGARPGQMLTHTDPRAEHRKIIKEARKDPELYVRVLLLLPQAQRLQLLLLQRLIFCCRSSTPSQQEVLPSQVGLAELTSAESTTRVIVLRKTLPRSMIQSHGKMVVKAVRESIAIMTD